MKLGVPLKFEIVHVPVAMEHPVINARLQIS